MSPRPGVWQTFENCIGYLFFLNSAKSILYFTFPSFLPTPPFLFFFSSFFSLPTLQPHTHVLSGSRTFSSTELLFFYYSFGFCIFPWTRYFHFFKNWEKNNVVSINKSASRESHFLSRFQKCFMVFRSPVCANQRWCFTYAGHTMPTSKPALCFAFHFRNENLDYLFITV